MPCSLRTGPWGLKNSLRPAHLRVQVGAVAAPPAASLWSGMPSPPWFPPVAEHSNSAPVAALSPRRGPSPPRTKQRAFGMIRTRSPLSHLPLSSPPPTDAGLLAAPPAWAPATASVSPPDLSPLATPARGSSPLAVPSTGAIVSHLAALAAVNLSWPVAQSPATDVSAPCRASPPETLLAPALAGAPRGTTAMYVPSVHPPTAAPRRSTSLQFSAVVNVSIPCSPRTPGLGLSAVTSVAIPPASMGTESAAHGGGVGTVAPGPQENLACAAQDQYAADTESEDEGTGDDRVATAARDNPLARAPIQPGRAAHGGSGASVLAAGDALGLALPSPTSGSRTGAGGEGRDPSTPAAAALAPRECAIGASSCGGNDQALSMMSCSADVCFATDPVPSPFMRMEQTPEAAGWGGYVAAVKWSQLQLTPACGISASPKRSPPKLDTALVRAATWRDAVAMLPMYVSRAPVQLRLRSPPEGRGMTLSARSW